MLLEEIKLDSRFRNCYDVNEGWVLVELADGSGMSYFESQSMTLCNKRFKVATFINDGWGRVLLQDGSGWTLYCPKDDVLLNFRSKSNHITWQEVVQNSPFDFWHLPSSFFKQENQTNFNLCLSAVMEGLRMKCPKKVTQKYSKFVSQVKDLIEEKQNKERINSSQSVQELNR